MDAPEHSPDIAAQLASVPGVRVPSTRRGRRAMSEIIDAARSVVVEVGAERASLREIARRAGYSPGALYNHFENKESLINALAMESVQVLGAQLQRAPETPSTPERLMRLGGAYLDFAKTEPERYRLIFDMLAVPSTRWDEFVSHAYPFSLIVQTCAEGLARRELIDRSGRGADALAYGLWSLVHGMVMLSAHHLSSLHDDLAPMHRAALAAHITGISTTEVSP